MASYRPLPGGSGGSAGSPRAGEAGDGSTSDGGAAPQATVMVFLVDLQVCHNPGRGGRAAPLGSALFVLVRRVKRACFVSRRTKHRADSAVVRGRISGPVKVLPKGCTSTYMRRMQSGGALRQALRAL